MISHILIDEATLDVDSLILTQFLHYSRELTNSFIKIACATEHQALVELGRRKIIVADKSIAKALNRLAHQQIF
jgi:hypothetical protein